MTDADLLPPALLKRKAVVYVRQSTQAQVQSNLEGQRRQYELVDEARRRGVEGLHRRDGRGRLHPGDRRLMVARIRESALSLDEAVLAVRHDGAGAVATFVGVVRDRNDGRTVTLLEYEAYGLPFEAPAVRLRRMAESATIIRALWSETTVDFEGEFYTLKEALCDPKPHDRASTGQHRRDLFFQGII